MIYMPTSSVNSKNCFTFIHMDLHECMSTQKRKTQSMYIIYGVAPPGKNGVYPTSLNQMFFKKKTESQINNGVLSDSNSNGFKQCEM